jgi:hypothetical protein
MRVMPASIIAIFTSGNIDAWQAFRLAVDFPDEGVLRMAIFTRPARA